MPGYHDKNFAWSIPMTPLIRRALTFSFVALTAFMISHTLTGVVSHALLPPLEYSALGASGQRAAEAPRDLPQLMRDIEASRLFETAPVSAITPTVGPTGAPISMAGRQPLNVASKIRLLGTVVGDAAQSAAMIEELASKKQGAYRIHDQIVGLGEVVAIRRESIIVGQAGLEEELFLDILQRPVPPPSSAPVATGTVVTPGGGTIRRSVDRAELDQTLANVPALMTQARALPFMNNGKMEGFRLDFIQKGSFFEKLGLQAGDVLQRINGVELRDPGTALSLFQQLRTEHNVAVDVLRNNQRTTLAYDIRG